jgi:hypothetical protein
MDRCTGTTGFGRRKAAYHSFLALAIAQLATLSACAGSSAAASASRPRPESAAQPAGPPVPMAETPYFVPGETITWDVTFAGITGGRARLAIGQIGEERGKRMVVLRGEAESAGVLSIVQESSDQISSWVDVASGLPTRTESSSTGFGKPLMVHAERVSGAPVAEVDVWSSRAGDGGTHKQARLPNLQTHDPLSILLALRAWVAPRGGHATVYSLGGMRVWKNEFTVEGREDLDGPLGRRAAVRIAGKSTRISAQLTDDLSRPPRTWQIWLSDDAQRLPLRFAAHTEYGDVIASLTSYTVAE